jgi:hypothetical protein
MGRAATRRLYFPPYPGPARNPPRRVESPTCPPLLKGSCEKIERTKAKASFVVRGRGNFLPSKPGGKYMAVKHCPGFRRATSATCGNSYKSKQRILRASVGSIPSGPRRNKRLFWRQEISPSPGIPRPPNFSLPEFFHSFRGAGGISGRAVALRKNPATGCGPAHLEEPLKSDESRIFRKKS